MKTFVRRGYIFETNVKKMRYSVRHRRYVTFYNTPKSEILIFQTHIMAQVMWLIRQKMLLFFHVVSCASGR